MNCLSPAKSKEQEAQERKTAEINTSLKNDAQKPESHTRSAKLLLLGTGDSGKSTFQKQMIAIHTKGELPLSYYESFIPTLRENCLRGMKGLIAFFTDVGEKIPGVSNDELQKLHTAQELTPEVATLIKKIWCNTDFQELSMKADDAQVQGGISGIEYYFMNGERFADLNYKPTYMDTLKARRATTGIHETRFAVGGHHFVMVDVGGQRSERKKWLNCFSDVSAVIFLSAVNEYDMVLEEDESTNRLVESLKLWKVLTLSLYFKTTPFILFLNKTDLFKEKIARVPLIEVFKEYEQFEKDPAVNGLDEYEKSWRYIAKQYKMQFSGSIFYTHPTCALDTDNCKKVFTAIRDTLFKEAINVVGFK